VPELVTMALGDGGKAVSVPSSGVVVPGSTADKVSSMSSAGGLNEGECNGAWEGDAMVANCCGCVVSVVPKVRLIGGDGAAWVVGGAAVVEVVVVGALCKGVVKCLEAQTAKSREAVDSAERVAEVGGGCVVGRERKKVGVGKIVVMGGVCRVVVRGGAREVVGVEVGGAALAPKPAPHPRFPAVVVADPVQSKPLGI
jgi:hypothetical protein